MNPSFDAIFAAMSAASVGDLAARVAVPDGAQLGETSTRFALALNVLLDDLARAAADRKRELSEPSSLASRLQILADASAEFAAATADLDQLLDVVARRLGQHVGDMCAIRAVSADGEWLESAGAVYHRDPELLALTREVVDTSRQRVGEGVSGHVARAGQPLLTPEIHLSEYLSSSDPRYRPFLERLGARTAITLPLMCRGKVVGIANLLRGGPNPYTRDDLVFVQNIADHAALAIANARSYAAERAARDAAEKATNALRQSEARFARLRDSGILGILVMDLDGRVTDANDALLKLVGYSREEILSGRVAWKNLTPPEWHEVNTRAFEQLRTRGLATLREKEFLRKDGKRVPILAASAMLEDGSSESISFVLDLTERKESESAIARLRDERAAEARLAALVDASDDAIIGKTLEGVITSWNPGACRIFGYGADEIVGRSIALLVPPGRETEEPTILEAAASGQVQRFDTVRRRKDGTEIDVSVTISPVRDGAGRVVAVSKVARDITARRRAEEALARAKDSAEAANRELEAFSYSVAHDLRAPLRGMNGFAQLLLDTYKSELDAEGQDWLQEIMTNAKKMGELIDALLSLARVTRSELRPERVDLSECVRDAASRLRALEPDRAIEIEVQDDLHAEVDSRLARALVDNLLGNAWKFTRLAPRPRIDFGAIEKDGELAFFVRDNGAGFDMAFASNLFAPFQRLHTTAEFPGTGIGLATVQRIVHRHGSRVWAEGEVNHGATFYFSLPAHGPGVAP